MIQNNNEKPRLVFHEYKMKEWNGVLCSFQRIVRLYQDSNLRRD